MDSNIWNPWHGCIKYSEGCRNCYVYRRDESIGKDASVVTRTKSFDLPICKNKYGDWKIPSGSHIYACMTSDFFVEQADEWRKQAWDMIKTRSDVDFTIITKRIVRFPDCVPDDWGTGYPNVSIVCTVENQRQCDIRLPIFKELPIRYKLIACEPLLSKIDMSLFLDKTILQVLVGGESGNAARVCDYDWVLDLRHQCIEAGVPFYFKQTGYRFKKDGRIYTIPRKLQHVQAQKADINTPRFFRS